MRQIRTSFQLIRAIAGTARRHKGLLLFPVLSILTTASLLLGIFALGDMLIAQADDVSPMRVVGLVVAFTLLFFYLQFVTKTFFEVALTFAAFRALRDEPTPLLAALAHALARMVAIVQYTGAAIAAGVLPYFDVAWSIVQLMAIPVLVRERCSGFAAIRRAVNLFRERWGETSIAVVSLRLLWMPLAAASFFVFEHRVWLGLFLLVCAAPMLVESFVRSIYGAALYVFAVEGVVPAALDTAELATVWRVGNVPAGGAAPAAGADDDLRASRGFRWAPAAVLIAMVFVPLSLAGRTPQANRPLQQIRTLMSGSAPGLIVNDQNFPDQLRMVWSRDLGVPILGLVGGADGQVVAGGPASFFVLNREGRVLQQFANAPRGDDWTSMVSGDLMASAHLPGITGTSSIVSGKWGQAIRAYDASGAQRWAWQMADGGAAVDDIAAISVPSRGDLVAVGHNGFGGLCLLDARGVEQWCNTSIGNVDFVAAIDCDGDGQDEILSKSPHSHPYFGSKLGCYSTEGKLVRDVNVSSEPFRLRTFNVRGDGRRDLLAWFKDGLNGPLVLAAWTADGHVLGELRLQRTMKSSGATVFAVKVRDGRGSDIAVSLEDGWVVGASLDGERWGHHFSGADQRPLAIAALDVDGDGRQELIIASGTTVSAWTWNDAPHPRQQAKILP